MKIFLIAVLVLIQGGGELRTQTGTVTGQLRQADGSPAAGVRVALIAETNTAGTAVVETLLNIGESDATGRYRLEGVTPGRYVVTAAERYAPTYYPGVKTSAEARVITVTAGNTTAAIDFQIPLPTGPVRVRGQVEGLPAGAPTGVLRAHLTPIGPATLTQLATDVRADGSFEFPRIAPGAYGFVLNLGVRTQPLRQIAVGGEDLELPPIRLEGLSAWGRVTIEEGGDIPSIRPELTDVILSPPSHSRIVLTRTEASGQRGRGESSPTVIGLIRETGLFFFQPDPVEYKVTSFELPIGHEVKSLTYGNADLLTSPFRPDSSRQPAEIRMVLTTKAATGRTIRGRVQGAIEASPATWARIATLSDAGQRQASSKLEIRHLGATKVRPDGTFEFVNVAPGTYTLGTYKNQVSGPAAVTVTVAGSDISGIELKPPPTR